MRPQDDRRSKLVEVRVHGPIIRAQIGIRGRFLPRDPELIELQMAGDGFWSGIKHNRWFVVSANQLVACDEAISYITFVFTTCVCILVISQLITHFQTRSMQ